MKKSIQYALVPALTLAFVGTAQAQQGNLSDAVTTGSATTVVNFAPAPAPPGAGPAGGPAGGAPAAAAAPAATQALGAASTATTTQLSSGTMTTTTGAPIAPAAQATVVSVMSTSSPVAAQQLTTALGGSPGAGALVGALGGLLGAPVALAAAGDDALTVMLLESMAAPDLESLHNARDAFNDFVGDSSAEFLASPPDEFLAIHATLTQLIEAVNRAVI